MLLVARTLAEDLVLKPIAREFLSREAVDRAVKAMRRMQVPPKPDRRLAELRRLVTKGAFGERSGRIDSPGCGGLNIRPLILGPQ